VGNDESAHGGVTGYAVCGIQCFQRYLTMPKRS
jgi:hypothetical protein